MTPVVWIHYARPRPHWYALSETDKTARQAAWTEIANASKLQGAENVGRYHIRGQQDYETVEIWRFTNAEAAADHWSRLTVAGYNEWFAFSNNIGLAMEALA
jgi:hypothetical protein